MIYANKWSKGGNAVDSDRMKKAAQWFYSTVFRDEAIRRTPPAPAEKLPPLLRTARSLENAQGNPWQSRESVFLKQAKLLANYHDDYSFTGTVMRYYPTYQALTDRELRGYFSWRTALRRGDLQKTCLSFVFLHIYELLNQVGVENPADGYHKLVYLRDAYGLLDSGILPYLNRWITDYVVYYGLDAGLLADSPLVVFDRSVTVLEMAGQQPRDKVIFALKQLAPKWLSRSKFYSEDREDFDTVMARVLARVSDHYAKHAKRTMTEQFFGKCGQFQVRLFDTAVFCDPLKKRRCEYVLSERRVYRCEGGLWTLTCHPVTPASGKKLEELVKTVDAVMREEYGYKHPIKYETQTKWLIKAIREEVALLLSEKQAAQAKKITIDYSQLEKIRREAAVTQQKLTVEEEMEEETLAAIPEPPPADPEPSPATVSASLPSQSCPLSGPEYRLLQCLLYGRSISWVQAEGHLLSVLVDSINETLYDTFLDSVLDDTPELVEDYIEDLKEMVAP